MQRYYEPVHFWYFSWGQARNSQQVINSTTGVVLVSEVQPGPYQVFDTVDGTDVFALFATPSQGQIPILQLEHWSNGDKVTHKSKV